MFWVGIGVGFVVGFAVAFMWVKDRGVAGVESDLKDSVEVGKSVVDKLK